MLNTRQIHPLTDFLRNHKAHLARLKETKTSEILTVNGRAEIVFGDGTLLHLSYDTDLEVLAEEHLRLTSGRAIVRISHGAARPSRAHIATQAQMIASRASS